VTAEQLLIGLGGWQQQGDHCHSNDHRHDATLTTPIMEQDQTTHHWPMVGGRRSGGWVMMCRITQVFLLSLF
jgi:hypothetical protein